VISDDEGKKVFFFEKKKQKTFVCWRALKMTIDALCDDSTGAKVFCFLLSKKKTFLLRRRAPPQHKIAATCPARA
jgi:hypothetical protein